MSDLEPWQVISEKQAEFTYNRSVARTYRLPSGEVETWDVLVSRPTVAALAMTSDRRVIVARQFRPGPDRWLTELPGGYVDDGETPAAAARRELVEETGWVPERLDVVGGFWDSAGSTRYRYAAIAHDCTYTGAMTELDRRRIVVELLAFSAFIDLLRSGELTDTHAAYRCLDALGLFNSAEREHG